MGATWKYAYLALFLVDSQCFWVQVKIELIWSCFGRNSLEPSLESLQRINIKQKIFKFFLEKENVFWSLALILKVFISLIPGLFAIHNVDSNQKNCKNLQTHINPSNLIFVSDKIFGRYLRNYGDGWVWGGVWCGGKSFCSFPTAN